MKNRFFMVLIVFVIGISVRASADILDINPFNQDFLLANDARDIEISSIKVTQVPISVRVSDCDTDYNFCPGNIILQSVQVLQVQVQYTEPSLFEEPTDHFFEVNFPLDQVNPKSVQEVLKAAQFTFDFSGKKRSFLKELANRLVRLQIREVNQPVRSVDDSHSVFCSTDAPAWSCEENLVYQTINVRMKSVRLELK